MTHSDFRFPSVDYDDILTLTFDLTKDMKEVKKVFRLAVFNLISHNRDDHAKNFSYLLGEDNNWIFSPAYDLTFSSGVGSEHSTTYMAVGRDPSIKELMELADKHSIKDAKMIIDDIYTVTNSFKDYAKKAEVSGSYADDIFRQFVKF